MDIKLIEDKNSTLEVQIKYPIMNAQVKNLIHRIKSIQLKICATDDDGNETMINIYDIFYIESIERKTFIYTRDKIFRTSKKLYMLLDEFKDFGFLQINKSCILNIEVLESVKTIFNSRLKATLSNGEQVIITRTYIPAIKKWLDGEED